MTAKPKVYVVGFCSYGECSCDAVAAYSTREAAEQEAARQNREMSTEDFPNCHDYIVKEFTIDPTPQPAPEPTSVEPLKIPCTLCRGEGWNPTGYNRELIQCSQCNGSGEIILTGEALARYRDIRRIVGNE